MPNTKKGTRNVGAWLPAELADEFDRHTKGSASGAGSFEKYLVLTRLLELWISLTTEQKIALYHKVSSLSFEDGYNAVTSVPVPASFQVAVSEASMSAVMV